MLQNDLGLYQPPQASLGKADILIVDDTPDNLRVLSAMLTHQGYDVRKTLSGRMALHAVQAELPDLILMDIKMPDMDGYEVCRQLKSSDDAIAQVPVIFISALDAAWDKVLAFSVGGVDYITKPFQEAEVLVRVENQLRLQALQHQLLEQNHQLRQLNQELLRSNRELEQFAHAVSHDLQQPLQSILGFAKLIEMKEGSLLQPTTQQGLQRIMQAGHRMQQFIHDVLAYAQSGMEKRLQEPVDCNQVIKQVKQNLDYAFSTQSVMLTCPSLPIVLGNETQLVQLFQNLMSNAIKFSRTDVSPCIEISVALQGDYWCFRVKDNGIGIDTEQFHRIFEAFQRSHTQYPGFGIGLATCKRIVEQHGGAIWLESQPQQGSEFYFTLLAGMEPDAMN